MSILFQIFLAKVPSAVFFYVLALGIIVNGSILYWLTSKREREIFSHVGHGAGEPQSWRCTQTIVMTVHSNVKLCPARWHFAFGMIRAQVDVHIHRRHSPHGSRTRNFQADQNNISNLDVYVGAYLDAIGFLQEPHVVYVPCTSLSSI